MKPLKNFVLLTQIEDDKEIKTEGGLILTRSQDAGTKPGTVEAVGPDVVDVKVGDVVYVQWKDALPVTYNNKLAGLVRDISLCAVL